MRKTPLYAIHESHGAKFGEFAGFDMPLFYKTGIIGEHKHTREKAGLFDISHMMLAQIGGGEASLLIEKLCPLKATDMNDGDARYTFFLNKNAGIIDDLIVSRLGENLFSMVCNAGCADKDLAHIKIHAKNFDVNVSVLDHGIIALQGPMAELVLQDINLPVADMKFMQTIEHDDWLISRSGYTGEDGFEIAMPAKQISEFAEKLIADERVIPIGLGARDSLRLEAGLSLYGQDLSDTITPMEAGLVWAIPKELRSDGNYIGAPAIEEKITNKRKRKRVGIKPDGKAPVRAGSIILDAAGEPVGEITSGGFGPTVEHPVAMGLINVEANLDGLVAQVRSKLIPLQIAPLPFSPHHYKR